MLNRRVGVTLTDYHRPVVGFDIRVQQSFSVINLAPSSMHVVGAFDDLVPQLGNVPHKR